MRIRRTAVTLLAGAVLSCLAGPAVAAGDPPPTSDDCTLDWVTLDKFENGYFGDARLQCPVLADVGARWTLDGQEVRKINEKRGPGEVAVFDDFQPDARPGQELCFIVTAWFNDKGKKCLLI